MFGSYSHRQHLEAIKLSGKTRRVPVRCPNCDYEGEAHYIFECGWVPLDDDEFTCPECGAEME